jgi:type II secretory pathway component PulF
MASYRWRALTGEGRVIEGVEQAGSRAALLSALEARDLLPIDIDAASAMSEPSEPVDRAALSRTELHHATQELAMLLKQGVALDRALGVLAAGSKPAVRVLFEGLRNDILCGRSFAQALGRHPGQFSRAYVAMVASAERAGTLDRSLELLSDDLAREIALRRKLTAAIAYPAFLLAAALMVLVFILVAVVPGFSARSGECGRTSRTRRHLLHLRAVRLRPSPLAHAFGRAPARRGDRCGGADPAEGRRSPARCSRPGAGACRPDADGPYRDDRDDAFDAAGERCRSDGVAAPGGRAAR